MDFISADDECDHRNAHLIAKHGDIPSYALWRPCDIENQTISMRISWWEDSEKTKGQQSILQSLYKMKENGFISESKINSDNSLKEIDQTKAKKSSLSCSKKNDVNEFCSKRYGNELYCDI